MKRPLGLWFWVGTSGLLILTLVWLISFRSALRYEHNGTFFVTIALGALWVENIPDNPPHTSSLGIFDASIWKGLGHPSWLPSYERFNARDVTTSLPLWPLIVGSGIPLVIAWRRNRRNTCGQCQECGYSLTGNTSGVCPECGTAMSSATDTSVS